MRQEPRKRSKLIWHTILPQTSLPFSMAHDVEQSSKKTFLSCLSKSRHRGYEKLWFDKKSTMRTAKRCINKWLTICLWLTLTLKDKLTLIREIWVDPWVEKVPWRRERLPTPVSWPGEFHGLYSGVAKSWTQLSNFQFHFKRQMINIKRQMININK